jgi:hypothetical protein
MKMYEIGEKFPKEHLIWIKTSPTTAK